MNFINSLFAPKLVEEESEEVQKALVKSHSYYVSQGKYDDALKITALLFRHQDKDGCFNIKNTIPETTNNTTEDKTTNNTYSEQWTKLLSQEYEIDEAIEDFFKKVGKYNLGKVRSEKL